MRKAFTLIELLAVMFIITILVGILLPAVQGVRDAARKSRCLSNQRQLAVGLLNYENSKGSLPGWRDYITVTPAADMAKPPVWQNGDELAAQASWVFCVLPQLEQTDLFDRLKTGQIAVGTPIPPIAVLQCPSHSEGPKDRGMNYVVNGGAADDFARSDPNVTTDGNVANGPFLDRANIIAGKVEDKYKYAVARMEDISKMDGTAHTLLTSENCQRGFWIAEDPLHFYNDTDGNPKTGASAGWFQLPDNRWSFGLAGHDDCIEGSVAFCWPRVYSNGGGSRTCYPKAGLGGNNPKQGFTAAQDPGPPLPDPMTGPFVPVNRGTYNDDVERIPCYINMFNQKTFATWYQSARPSSFHAGVVVASFCDGSVRSISANIDETVFVQLMTVGDAQSDAGWKFGSVPENFLYGKLFDSRGL